MNVSPFLLSAEYMHLQRVKDKISGENVWLVRYLSRDDSNNNWDNSRYVVNWKTNVNCHLGVNIGKYFRIEIYKKNDVIKGNIYRQVSNIRRTLVCNRIVDNSDVVGASPVGAAPTTSELSTKHLASVDWAQTTARRNDHHLSFDIWCVLY